MVSYYIRNGDGRECLIIDKISYDEHLASWPDGDLFIIKTGEMVKNWTFVKICNGDEIHD